MKTARCSEAHVLRLTQTDQQLYWWAEIFYQAALPLTRISILFFYLKVFPQDSIRWASFILMGLNVAYLIAFEIATIFQCYPIYGAWTFWDGSFDGHCNNIHLQSWLSAAFNILLGMLSSSRLFVCSLGVREEKITHFSGAASSKPSGSFLYAAIADSWDLQTF
jgi:hypothetical protein